jgi:hypothetical protein
MINCDKTEEVSVDDIITSQVEAAIGYVITLNQSTITYFSFKLCA